MHYEIVINLDSILHAYTLCIILSFISKNLAKAPLTWKEDGPRTRIFLAGELTMR